MIVDENGGPQKQVAEFRNLPRNPNGKLLKRSLRGEIATSSA